MKVVGYVFLYTKGTSLRRATYFGSSNVRNGQCVWPILVSKNKVGKGRGREGNFELELSLIFHGQWDGVSINKLWIRVQNGHVMICADVGLVWDVIYCVNLQG